MKPLSQPTKIAMTALLVLLPSCLKNELPQTEDGTTAPDNVQVAQYAGFDFSTISVFTIDISLLDSRGAAVDGAYVAIYSAYPLIENGQKAPDCGSAQIFHGVTDAAGTVQALISAPSSTDSIYVNVEYAGLPTLTAVALTGSSISIRIGGTASDQIATASSLKSGAIAAPTLVNGYITLGTWNYIGVPSYLTASDNIPSSLLDDINASLPEYKRLPLSHPQYLANESDINLDVKENCEIWVSFVHEGAGWLNSLGYYTYPTGSVPSVAQAIRDRTIIFPNVSLLNSGGGLVSGNKVQLQYLDPMTKTFSSTFPAGVTVGWFLVAQGWKNGTVGSGVYTHYSDVEYNQEPDADLRKHNVMLYDQARQLLVMGFEDVRRDKGSDEDFNDAVFYATVSPFTAVDKSAYQPIDKPIDTDGDGVTDVFDQYPTDRNKAFNNYYPAAGAVGTLAFEDLWPYQGDYDFNDLVVQYRFNSITNAQNTIAQLETMLSVRAIGASYHNAFGIQLGTAAESVAEVTGTRNTKGVFSFAGNGTEAGQSKATVIFFDDAYNALPYPGQGVCVNTYKEWPYAQPDSMSATIKFASPVSWANLGAAPYNPFIVVNGDRKVEIHLPNHQPTDLADVTKLGTGSDISAPSRGQYYMCKDNLPWAINIPSAFSYPVEKEDVRRAFPYFDSWAASNGLTYSDWYTDRSGYRINSRIY